jgi:ABC-2 type transport system permease protein
LTIFTFIFPLVIGYSVVEMIFDRESLKKDIFAMKRYKYLLSDLVSKDIKTKYRRSLLGVLWSVLNPLLMMAVLTAIFSNIIRVEVEGGFALFYLTGYIIFNFISEATSFALYTITSAAPLIKKVYIPKYVFPLEKCIFSLVNMLFSLIAFVIVFVAFSIAGKITPHLTMLMFPIPMVLVFIFCHGICLILSATMVFFRDIGHIWGILLTIWMYASPIIYPIDIDILPAWLVSVLRLNPLTHYIDYFRSVMIYGRVPSASETLICVLFSLASLLFGAVIFRKKQDKFLLHI